MTKPAAGAIKDRPSDKWIRHTQALMAGCLVEDDNFLVALGMAAGRGATNPLMALDMICAHYRADPGPAKTS